jgi:hypothetical protein
MKALVLPPVGGRWPVRGNGAGLAGSDRVTSGYFGGTAFDDYPARRAIDRRIPGGSRAASISTSTVSCVGIGGGAVWGWSGVYANAFQEGAFA